MNKLLINRPRFSRTLLQCLCLCFSLLALSANADTSAKQIWTEDPKQEKLVLEIVEIMQDKHFRKLPMDDALASMILDNYLEALDPNRVTFLQSDINEFNAFRKTLDDEMQAGKLDAVRAIYSRYYERYTNRIQWTIKHIDPLVKNEKFTDNDELEIDREKSPWPSDIKAAQALWLGILKNEILGLKLADKPKDNIAATLTRRLQTQLDRLNKRTAMENFEIFMNSYTELYDPHTNFLSPKSSNNFDIGMVLSLEGIGAMLEKDDENTKVVRLVPAGPADRQGELKAGDFIMAIAQGKNSEEWTDVVGWRLDEVVELIRGKADTWVRLQVKRGDDVIKLIAIKREKVKLEDQAASKKIVELPSSHLGKTLRIGIIKVPSFYLDFDAVRRGDPEAKSTTRDVAKILDELRISNIDGIVIDLRDNGGGSLMEATQLTDLFIDRGPVVQILNSENQVDRRNRAVGTFNYDGPLLVLVNHFSASASEIFAGAIQDYQRGLIVGEQTFGKGTVQTLIPLQDGKLKITESKFYRVSGDSTQHRGVVPDISFPAMMPYDEVGESALDHALPWDQIQSAPHYRFMNLEAYVPSLAKKHEARMKNNVEYDYLLSRSRWIDETGKRKTISLNLVNRENVKKNDNKKLLDMENNVRLAKGIPPFSNVSEIEQAAQKKREAKNPYDDFLLMEGARLLADFIEELSAPEKSVAASPQLNK